MKSTRKPVLSVQPKFVAMRRWPTASASFVASGSFSACAWYSSKSFFFWP